MSRMNYNRPNGGYESEPWRQTYEAVAAPKIAPLPVRQHQAQGHQVIVIKTKPGSVHAAAYRCTECNQHLGWASK